MAKVLIVIDGTFRFDIPADTTDFTFTELYDALITAGHQVTKAHRATDAHADIQSFSFATTDLLQFDVLWLIGHAGRNDGNSMGTSGPGITDAEIAAIANFMNAGGGVFATGDHDSIGSEMCGHIPRIRAMRSWYGINDSASPMPAAFPRNFPQISAGRAETTRRNPGGTYPPPAGADADHFVWFENQSDAVPQPIVAQSAPPHPILMNGADVITVYPDHMHEGNTLGVVGSYDYGQTLSFAGQNFTEFPEVAGNHEMPAVVATGSMTAFASYYAATQSAVGGNSDIASGTSVNTLSAYDGRKVGVGRIVTGSTFHHYIDINLTGDSSIDTDPLKALTGADAAKGFGFKSPGAEGTRAAIRAVYNNITTWLARPKPAIQLILERNTFSQTEASANSDFGNVILVTVDGLKPNQFPGGPIDDLTPTQAKLNAWAPVITPQEPAGITITPKAVDSDDTSLSDRVQRFTFTYQITLSAAAGGAFDFVMSPHDIRLDAALNSPAASGALTDTAWIQLVKAANPYMLDLDNGNTTVWLSSDVKIFPVVAGTDKLGKHLPDNATRAQALQYLHDVIGSITVSQFENDLKSDEVDSALHALPTTADNKNVYNFAIARVRLSSHSAQADNVRLFFRIFPSPTTASLTYTESGGVPTGSYKKTADPVAPIALPGTDPGNNEWWSFPVFAAPRVTPPSSQTDGDNAKDHLAPGSVTFFGALVDNNLVDFEYLPPTPPKLGAVSLKELVYGEHQCIVAQIEFQPTPIPNGANPFTSDKLSQRNIAFSDIANPGLDASRMALHTFELEATPRPISEAMPPDEIMLEWRGVAPPDGAQVNIYVPGWNAHDVVALADRFYPRHEIRATDTYTVSLPGGGARYVPIPTGGVRRTGVLSVDFPLGVKEGQRYDLAVRQITNRARFVDAPTRTKTISRQEAAALLKKNQKGVRVRAGGALPRGVFDLGNNRVLITDLRVLDDAGDHAVVVQHPSREEVAKAREQSARWRQTVGAFQLAVPVSVKSKMLPHYLRLLSIFRWRVQYLRQESRWYQTFIHYVELIAEKVRALGGDPYKVPATPDGNIPLPEVKGEDHDTVWLGEHAWTGKVSALFFDHFGDFEGFMLEAYDGSEHRFFSRETAILELARTAWLERYVVSVVTVSAHSRLVRTIVFR